jgi:RNA polymerase sigma factor (sigma-70 family)
MNISSNGGDVDQIANWIEAAKHGDDAALNQLAEYLLPKAFEFASWKMPQLSPTDDHEDVAISALNSLCKRFRSGKRDFQGLKELSSLLKHFVIGKIRDRHKYHYAEKRNINLNVDENARSTDGPSQIASPVQYNAIEQAQSVWLDDHSVNLRGDEKAYLDQMLVGLEGDVRGLLSELVKRLDEKPRQALMLLTSQELSNEELAKKMNCAMASVERYRRAIRRKLEEITSEAE